MHYQVTFSALLDYNLPDWATTTKIRPMLRKTCKKNISFASTQTPAWHQSDRSLWECENVFPCVHTHNVLQGKTGWEAG